MAKPVSAITAEHGIVTAISRAVRAMRARCAPGSPAWRQARLDAQQGSQIDPASRLQEASGPVYRPARLGAGQRCC